MTASRNKTGQVSLLRKNRNRTIAHMPHARNLVLERVLCCGFSGLIALGRRKRLGKHAEDASYESRVSGFDVRLFIHLASSFSVGMCSDRRAINFSLGGSIAEVDFVITEMKSGSFYQEYRKRRDRASLYAYMRPAFLILRPLI